MTDVDVLSEDAPLDLRLSDAELEAHREHITTFIRDAVEAAGADGTVLGLSGGIDSTLTAFLAVEALGEEGLHGLIMPSVANADDMMSDAEGVAEMLGIKYDVVEVQPIAETFFNTFPEAANDRMAAGNIYVRARGVLNYFVANHENRIVLGTGNRSEALTGYFTKYGDQAVDCNPIGNLYKQQVRQLAAHVGVPEDLVMQTPSAEMWSGQTDEKELGLTYDVLDAILALHIDGPLSKSATVRHLDVTEAQIDRVVELYERSAHKRSMPPAPSPLNL
ncbi:NAD+ synthase [Haloferax mediterranei ATCC 33500]|uniref:NH(3)-dependent NAD(+) synthetase n=1 Tax=Haloferax mediterranei (strain ATCC 33500 / DSM 1411 / JCM 8866 / NBRC 14739 / NCIMB 2177 / R-4) TaxID=523841 RepID=I3R5Z8_HALMT|nr:NAD+ synthase [Haloferax mediterranei]AFK19658.1 NAD synthetase [Haloferax mediterranei ATCC 33500]AHZ23047.1 NAD synthetase [Haloferax mediterranei ATCC 33500]ELZ99978.1 NAD synthetase [Haloferax mediterranei ATCC 33500]MDX5987600.1 NAD+ synthase [Haloferax mediterranei ATCC 33500]QCQ74088.1 NAD+ synthase [Haloferax mediterranei ATCC 33500]